MHSLKLLLLLKKIYLSIPTQRCDGTSASVGSRWVTQMSHLSACLLRDTIVAITSDPGSSHLCHCDPFLSLIKVGKINSCWGHSLTQGFSVVGVNLCCQQNRPCLVLATRYTMFTMRHVSAGRARVSCHQP